MVLAVLGILKAGAAYVPLDPDYPQQRLAFMLEDARVPVLLTQQHLLGRLPQHQARVLCLDAGGIAEFALAESRLAPAGTPMTYLPRATAENLAYVIYTSGSTGKPKGVLVTHRQRRPALRRDRAVVRLRRRRRVDALPLLRLRLLGLGAVGGAALRRPAGGRALLGQPLAGGLLRPAARGKE